MSDLNATSNMNITWQATPPRPLMYNASDPMNSACDQKSDNYMPGNISQSALYPAWDEAVPEGQVVCSISNSSYVFPCCEAFGGETRFACRHINCRLNSSYTRDWTECMKYLYATLNDTGGLPLEQCADGNNVSRLDKKNKKNHAARTTTVSKAALGVVLLLVVATAV